MRLGEEPTIYGIASEIMRLKFIRRDTRKSFDGTNYPETFSRSDRGTQVSDGERVLHYGASTSRQLLVAGNNSEHQTLFSVTILHLVGNRPGIHRPKKQATVVQKAQ